MADFYKRAADRGLMNASTAMARRTAVTEVLEVLEDGLETDVRALDVEDALVRFENLKATKFTPQSLATYKSRFRKAHEDYLSFLESPSTWKPSTRKSNRSGAAGGSPTKARSTSPTPVPTESPTGRAVPLMEYPFPVRDGVIGLFKLPIDLTGPEAERVARYITALAIPPEAE